MTRVAWAWIACACWLVPGWGAVEASYIARGDPEQVAAFVATLPTPSDRGDLAPEYPYTADGFTAAWCGEVLLIEPEGDARWLAAMLPQQRLAETHAAGELAALLLAKDTSNPRAAELLTSLTLPDLRETLRLRDEVRGGRAVVRADFRPRTPETQYLAPLMLRWPAPGPDGEAVSLFWRADDEPSPAAAERAAPREAAAWLDHHVSVPHTTDYPDRLLAAVMAAAGRGSVSLTLGADAKITMELRQVALRDALEGLARVANWSVRREDGYAMVTPSGLRAKLEAATPLDGWAIGRRDEATSAAAAARLRRQAWEVLAGHDRAACEAGTRLDELSPAGREAISRLALQRLAQRWALGLASLPADDGSLPCALIESERSGACQLVTPGWTQTVGGTARYKLRAAGKPWIELAVEQERAR